MLQLKNYSKAYNGQIILTISRFELGHGIYWVKGENGSGKSTLFKSISGLIPFEGECKVDDLDVRKHAVAYRKVVNYCEAEPLFPDFLTQKDLITFVGNAKGASSNQIENITDQLGSTSYFSQRTGTYSSGMLKKTGLAMAFLGSPQFIVLDEPFVTIDKESTQALVDLILENYKKGVSFLISSHVDGGADQLPITATYQINGQQLNQF